MGEKNASNYQDIFPIFMWIRIGCRVYQGLSVQCDGTLQDGTDRDMGRIHVEFEAAAEGIPGQMVVVNWYR